MNLEGRLTNSLNDILRSSGYVYEIINKNKKQSNLISGGNNQLITPVITAQLANNIAKFDELLDDTVSKFNDARWCIEQILENRQKQEELKLKEEVERQNKMKQDEERRKREEEAAEKKKLEETKKREEERKKREDQAKAAKVKLEQEEKLKKEKDLQQNKTDGDDMFNDFISPGFDFNINELLENNDNGNNGNNNNGNNSSINNNGNSNNDSNNNNNNSNNDNNNDFNGDFDIPNPSDILSSIDYKDVPEPMDNINTNNNPKSNSENKSGNTSGTTPGGKQEGEELDLDINNILGKNDLILDGINMSLLDQDDNANGSTNNNNNGNNNSMEEEFDVDNFLNQFAND